MILLGKEDYGKLAEPLDKVAINHYFARSVVNGDVPGFVYVDDAIDPRTFYVLHPYGMSLLFGEAGNHAFNARFRDYALNADGRRDKAEWMQAYPATWDTVLRDLFGDRLVPSAENREKKFDGIVELNTRVNFRFEEDRFLKTKPSLIPSGVSVVRSGREVYETMPGSVVPAYFWKDADDFLENGVGFSVFFNGELASTAYSAFIQGSKLEIGIETVEKFRGKGFARLACAALIGYCIGHRYEPVWACRLENTGSYLLAQQLGFSPSLEIPYYRLSS